MELKTVHRAILIPRLRQENILVLSVFECFIQFFIQDFCLLSSICSKTDIISSCISFSFFTYLFI